jgi:biotin carboxylase
VDFVAQAIRLALGETPSEDDMRPTRHTGVAQRWLFPAPGRVCSVVGVEDVAARPEVALCEIRVRAGDEVPAVESHRSRAGVVIATGATHEQAVEHAERAVADIVIQTEPASIQTEPAHIAIENEPAHIAIENEPADIAIETEPLDGRTRREPPPRIER